MEHDVSCKELEPRLVLYYYGDCGPEEQKAVAEHLKACSACTRLLQELRAVLPLTVKSDDPPQAFWEAYSQEMRKKLAATEQTKRSWWREVFRAPIFRPAPALATAVVLILAVAVIFTQGIWRPKQPTPEQIVMLDALPIAENLEFFEAMELLDALDLLEVMEDPADGSA